LGFPHDALNFKITKALDELEREKIDGLNEIILEVINLKKSELYEKLYNGSVLNKKIFAPDARMIENEKNQQKHLMARGFQILGKFPLYIPHFSSLISFANLNALYSLFILIYYAYAERKLGCEDLRNIYLSGLDHRVIHALDRFDKVDEVPKTDSEFLIKLKNVQWESSDSKNLLNKLNYIKSLTGQDRFGLLYQLRPEGVEDDFILFSAACSAVNRRQDKINQEDVIRAYKTYFKLIKTDITKYKAKPELNKNDIERTDHGFLVCEKCSGYYKLHEGEYPEDFDQCRCGGKLIYYENIDWLIKEGENNSEMNKN